MLMSRSRLVALLFLMPGVSRGQSESGPEISPAGGTFYRVPVHVRIASPLSGAVIRYTLDGSDPTAASRPYTGSFPLRSDATVKARAFKVGEADGAVASATFTIEPAVVFDPLKGGSLGRAMGKGEFAAGGGWRSRGGHMVYDAGHPITDGYFEATMRGLEVPAKGMDKTHPLAGWETKNAYGHYLEQGSFFNWRVGEGYEAFKVLAASKSIGTRVEERVGSPPAVNDGRPHVYRVSWKDGKLDFLFDGKELRSWTMERFQLQYFTLGHDLQYFEISDPAPIISDVKIVDRSLGARKASAK
jgi:hypothetical protein